MRSSLGVGFLLVQLGAVIVAQFGPRRYFCWAPNDYMTDYQLSVSVNGHPLSGAEIFRRYRMAAVGLKENVAQHLMDIVVEYERNHGRDDRVSAVLRYRTNGGEERVWQFQQK